MMVYLVLLARGAARDKGIDKEGQTRPPEVTFDDGLGAEDSEISFNFLVGSFSLPISLGVIGGRKADIIVE